MQTKKGLAFSALPNAVMVLLLGGDCVASGVDMEQRLKRVRCFECGKTCYRGNLRRHQISIHRNVRYNCSLCQRDFGLNQSLKRHLKNVHSRASQSHTSGRNATSRTSGFTSKFKGVSRYISPSGVLSWRAQVSINGENMYLGLFPSEEMAYAEYLSELQRIRNMTNENE